MLSIISVSSHLLSPGELLDATASPSSSSSSSSRDLLGETPSTGDDVLDRFSRNSPAVTTTTTKTTSSNAPSAHHHPSSSSSATPHPLPALNPSSSSSRCYRPSNAVASKPRSRTNVKTVTNSSANFKESILPIGKTVGVETIYYLLRNIRRHKHKSAQNTNMRKPFTNSI